LPKSITKDFLGVLELRLVVLLLNVYELLANADVWHFILPGTPNQNFLLGCIRAEEIRKGGAETETTFELASPRAVLARKSSQIMSNE
jgi:hypothetical protein